MKTLALKALVIAAVAIFALVLIAATNTPAPPLHELNIAVNSSTNLNTDRIRITVDGTTLDAATYLPLLRLNLEAWSQEVIDGITNQTIVSKRTLSLTSTNLKSWVNSADPKAFLEAAILQKVNLTKKP